MRPLSHVGAGLPVSESVPIRLSREERRELRRLGQRVLADEPRLAWLRPFGPRVRSGLVDAPSLILPDHSGVALREVGGLPPLEYRMLGLGSAGDLMALTPARCLAFEACYRDLLGFGAVEVHNPAPGAGALWSRCMADPVFMERAVERARRYRHLNLLPYMGFGGAWLLAGAVAAASDARVTVAAPPPNLTARVNDKLWFARRVSELLGPRASPPALPAHGPASLAARVAHFARRFDHVCLKVPSSAGSEGNAMLESGPLRRLALGQLRDLLMQLVASRGWGARFPLLVGVWEAPVLVSPSVQLWIPEPEQDPVVEGVFSQVLSGATGQFVGVAPSALAPAWIERLGHEAALLGGLFQELGYFGRCSFDALLVGAEPGAAELLWIECNGRWGGTSMPMTLATRLARPRPTFVVVEVGGLGLEPRPFEEALEQVFDLHYRPGARRGIVFLTPTRVEAGQGLDFLAMAESPEEASVLSRRAMDLLTAVIPPAGALR